MISISVYNIDLEKQALLSTFVSLVWEEGYNTEGMFQLECVLDEELIGLFQLEWYCGLTGHDTLMVIKSVQVKDNKIVVNGYPATHIFSDRVSTAVISAENAEVAMRGLFSDMEEYPCFELGTLAGLSDKFENTYSDGTLLEYYEAIGQACDIGFKMYHDKENKKLLYTVYKGEDDANAKYSTMYGNMGDITYTITSNDYKNVAIVAGQGTGDERVTVYAGDTEATGSERREMYVDARNVQQEDDETDEEYEERLIEYGEEKLLAQLEEEDITFELAEGEAELGAMVYCRIPEIGIDLSVRIAIIQEAYSNNIKSTYLTLGTPVITRRY